MVIFNHSNGRGFHRYITDNVNSWVWVWDTFLSTMCKVGVPLFFMISGANLIGKEETFRKSFKRANRIIVCLFFWSLFYYYIEAITSNADFNVLDSLTKMIKNYYWHLWYLYAYVAFIFTLPILRKLSINLGLNEFIFLLVIGTILTFFLPIISNSRVYS